jgi:hypothetical protein
LPVFSIFSIYSCAQTATSSTIFDLSSTSSKHLLIAVAMFVFQTVPPSIKISDLYGLVGKTAGIDPELIKAVGSSSNGVDSSNVL